jgi:hypothetical protein
MISAIRYGEADDEYFIDVWHPDPRHWTNQPGVWIEDSQGPHPWRYRHAEVRASGVLGPVIKEEEMDEETRWLRPKPPAQTAAQWCPIWPPIEMTPT